MLNKRVKKRFPGILAAMLCILAFTLPPAPAFAGGMGEWEVDGFLRNNTGIWTENWDYALNNDPLATCRNWFRLNLNGNITKSLKLKAELLAIYEPEYSRERHGIDGATPVGANYYNYFDFRELRLDWYPIPGHSFQIGRQIVNWGESISARVGDVVNPVDSRFDLGFTNLEDTRMPIWMIRGLHQFISLRSSLDWIFSPYMEPDRYRVTRQPSSIGHVNTDGTFIPASRFGAYPATLAHMQEYYGVDGTYVYLGPGMAMPIANASALGVVLPIIGAPFDRMWSNLPANWDTLGAPGGLYLTGIPNPLDTDYPDASLEDSRWGFKTSSTLLGCETGVYFWHANEIDGTFRIEGSYLDTTSGMMVYNIRAQYPKQNVYGFYSNKNFSFGVIRLDAAYRPGREYNTLDQTFAGGIVEKDYLTVQLGLNKDVMLRKLNPGQAFSFILEYVGNYFLTGDMDQAAVPSYWVPYHKDSHTFFLSGGTNYNFGMYSYDLTVIYNTRNNGLIQPSFSYSPEWMNRKWKFTLQYSTIFGDNDYDYPFGLAREKDMVILTTQFSFP